GRTILGSVPTRSWPWVSVELADRHSPRRLGRPEPKGTGIGLDPGPNPGPRNRASGLGTGFQGDDAHSTGRRYRIREHRGARPKRGSIGSTAPGGRLF